VERLDAALKRNKEVPGLRLLRAEMLALKGDLVGAEADARMVLDSDANLPGTVNLLVAIYTARGDLDKAAQSLEELEQAGKLRGAGRELLGRLYLTHGDSSRARVQFERALADSPDLGEAKNSLAFVLASERADLDRALKLAQEAQSQLPNVPEVVDTLGFVYLQKGLNDAAIDRFRFAIELAAKGTQPSPSIQYHLGLALAAAGRSQEAVEAFEKALAAGTTFPEADAARNELERARATGSSAPPAGRS
jgi:tetratricopeptide (TPR) repeat protein